MKCLNRDALEYRILEKVSGVSGFDLDSCIRYYLDEHGRYPYLDEIPDDIIDDMIDDGTYNLYFLILSGQLFFFKYKRDDLGYVLEKTISANRSQTKQPNLFVQ